MAKATQNACARLRRWRFLARLTQQQAADKLGTDQGTYTHYEVGDRLPSRPMRRRIASITRIPAKAWDELERERAGSDHAD